MQSQRPKSVQQSRAEGIHSARVLIDVAWNEIEHGVEDEGAKTTLIVLLDAIDAHLRAAENEADEEGSQTLAVPLASSKRHAPKTLANRKAARQ